MYFDKTEMINYVSEFRKIGNNLSSEINTIEKDFGKCFKEKNMDSSVRPLLYDELKILKGEIDKINNLLLNTNNYLDDVITNYQNFESTGADIFANNF